MLDKIIYIYILNSILPAANSLFPTSTMIRGNVIPWDCKNIVSLVKILTSLFYYLVDCEHIANQKREGGPGEVLLVPVVALHGQNRNTLVLTRQEAGSKVAGEVDNHKCRLTRGSGLSIFKDNVPGVPKALNTILKSMQLIL